MFANFNRGGVGGGTGPGGGRRRICKGRGLTFPGGVDILNSSLAPRNSAFLSWARGGEVPTRAPACASPAVPLAAGLASLVVAPAVTVHTSAVCSTGVTRLPRPCPQTEKPPKPIPAPKKAVRFRPLPDVREIERVPKKDVVSPDLMVVSLACEMAHMTGDVGLATLANAAVRVRRRCGAHLRSVMRREESGDLDSAQWEAEWKVQHALDEDLDRLLLTMDDRVSCLCPPLSRGVPAGAASPVVARLWHLKDVYRTSRRQMTDGGAVDEQLWCPSLKVAQ